MIVWGCIASPAFQQLHTMNPALTQKTLTDNASAIMEKTHYQGLDNQVLDFRGSSLLTQGHVALCIIFFFFGFLGRFMFHFTFFHLNIESSQKKNFFLCISVR